MEIYALRTYRILTIKRSDITIKRGELYHRYHHTIPPHPLIILINLNYSWYMKPYVVLWELTNPTRKIIAI